MADVINYNPCSDNFGNRGNKYCLADVWRYFTDIVISQTAQKFSSASVVDATAFQTALRNSQIEEVAQRTFLMPILGEVTDNTEDPTKVTNGYGRIVGYSEKNHTLMVELDNEGVYQLKQDRKWNFTERVNVYFKTDSNLLLGNTNSSREFMGIEASIHIYQPKVGNVSAPESKHMMEITLLDTNALSDNLDYIALDSDFKIRQELKGVNNLALTASDTVALGFSVKVLSEKDSNINVGDVYKTELADVDAWTFKNKSTGVTVAPATATWDSVNEVFDLTFADAATLVGGLVSPKNLAVLGVGSAVDGGFESDKVEVTITAGS
jgi:hypothetical protein